MKNEWVYWGPIRWGGPWDESSPSWSSQRSRKRGQRVASISPNEWRVLWDVLVPYVRHSYQGGHWTFNQDSYLQLSVKYWKVWVITNETVAAWVGEHLAEYPAVDEADHKGGEAPEEHWLSRPQSSGGRATRGIRASTSRGHSSLSLVIEEVQPWRFAKLNVFYFSLLSVSYGKRRNDSVTQTNRRANNAVMVGARLVA